MGVLRQTRPSPKPLYRVLGLAVVGEWSAGYFLLEGIPNSGVGVPRVLGVTLEYPDDRPESQEDARRRIMAAIVLRQGQVLFRDTLLRAYEGRCAVTGCDVLETLEAAHILPYRGEHTNAPNNGLLLRVDLHTLFDLGLIAIAENYSVLLSPKLRGTAYQDLATKRLRLPADERLHPSRYSLAQHREWSSRPWTSSE